MTYIDEPIDQMIFSFLSSLKFLEDGLDDQDLRPKDVLLLRFQVQTIP